MCALASALVVGLSVGATGAQAVTVGCYTATSATIDNVSMTAHWCWNAALNLTDLSWHQNQGSFLDAPLYIACGGPVVYTRSGGIGYHTASQTFYVTWCPTYGGHDDLFPEYWAHVVGGSHNLDFAEIGIAN